MLIYHQQAFIPWQCLLEYSRHQSHSRVWNLHIEITATYPRGWWISASKPKFYQSYWSAPCQPHHLDVHHYHDDNIKWKHFPLYWPFVRGIHWSVVDSHQKGQWRGALMFSVFCAWRNGWANKQDAGDLRHYHAHHHITVLLTWMHFFWILLNIFMILLLVHVSRSSKL